MNKKTTIKCKECYGKGIIPIHPMLEKYEPIGCVHCKGTGKQEQTMERMRIVELFVIMQHDVDMSHHLSNGYLENLESIITLEKQEARQERDKYHKMFLNSISCMSIGDFVVWRNEHIKKINQESHE